MTLFKRRTTKRSLGQGLVEFALVLPVLLLLIFGIIEFARLFAAWLAIQNAARFGVRYAVTGRFDPQYCDEAMTYFAGRDADGNNIAWITAAEDTAPNPLANGANDPANDCNIPRGVTEDEEKTVALQDYARLLSTWDATRSGAVAINLSTDPAVSGNYRNYLDNIWRSKGTVSDATTARANFGQLASYIGNPTASGYFNVSICSFANDATILRDATYTYFWNSQTSNPDAQYPAPCTRRIGTGNTYMYTDHPGAPSTRMQVLVTFRHPLITPFVSSLWPSIELVASRDGIVESFRKSKDVVLPSGPSGISTATPTPTNTATPTQTATATQTATPFPCSGNGATYEQWDGITGTSVTDLRNDPRYPDEPTSRSTRTTFNTGQYISDDYGGVLRALVCVPTTGNYRFWLNTDDGGELLLYTTPFTTTTPNVNGITDAAMTLIASEPSYRGYLDYSNSSPRRSNPISLTAGMYYYLKAVYKEGTGGDHAVVAWKKPGDPSFDTQTDNDTTYIIPQANLYQITGFPTTFCAGDGATYEVWNNISGTSVSNLTSNGAYPNSPTLRYDGTSEVLPSDDIPNFEAFEDWNDNFGGVVRAILCVPTTGSYQFWIASDDNSQLAIYPTQLRGPGAVTGADLTNMSTTIAGLTDANLTVIATVSPWTNSRQWDLFASQQSNVIALNAGYYYLKAIYKEGGGGDNLAVAWKKPNNTFSLPTNYSGTHIIPQTNVHYLRGLADPPATQTPTRTLSPTITQTRTRTFTPGPPTLTFTPGPPTATRTATRTRTATFTPGPATPSNTPAPPTNTPPPTNTSNVPSPTAQIPCPWPWPLSEQHCSGGFLNPGAPTPAP